MSQPKRYLCAFGMEGVMQPFEQGDWVTHADYAALQAEVERLKAETVKQIEAALPPVEAYIAKLEAENERLRLAGDALAIAGARMKEIVVGEHHWTSGEINEARRAWLAAKGVQP